MPQHAFVEVANSALTQEGVQRLVEQDAGLVERLGRPGGLVEVADEVLGCGPDVRAYLEAVPSAVQEAIRAGVTDALRRGRPVQLSFSPAYDFEARVYEYGGAVAIELKGPYTPPPFPRDAYLDPGATST